MIDTQPVDPTDPFDPTFVPHAPARVQSMLDNGVARDEILNRLVAAGEILAGPGSVVSILALDDEGLLRNAASPNLPADYLKAIDRLKPNPALGTCAAAAATGLQVITEDFCADDKWAELRHLPIALGFIGAWSMPIKDAEGRVLGTFGTYYRIARRPSAAEQAGISRLAQAAAHVLKAQTSPARPSKNAHPIRP